MNSIGVNGPAKVSTAAIASWPASSVADSRSPAARLPIWSWFWLATTSRDAGTSVVSIGAAVVATAERRERAVVEEATAVDLGQRVEALEVGVVPERLAGQRHVQRVVEVVAPLAVQAVAAGLDAE